MGASKQADIGARRQARRWRFASAILDEASWTLTIDGRRATIEPKPLEMLHELLLRAGQVVTKDELLDAVWPKVAVVEASVPTAIAKLRRVLGDDRGNSPIIETVSGIGYRLVTPVDVEWRSAPEPDHAAANHVMAVPARRSARRWTMVGGAAAVICCVLATAYLWRGSVVPAAPAAAAITGRDAIAAIRELDVTRIEAMLRAGWNPNVALDDQNNGALTFVLNVCEWDPNHDRRRLLLMARAMIDGGARVDLRNKWGDTPYSIAKAKRYCGPDHPVTRMLHALCYTGYGAPGDGCLATYARTPR